MGDMWGSWVPDEWIVRVLEHVRRFPETTFLFLTKNPQRYGEFKDLLSDLDNVILGATIETNRDYGYKRISRAPWPSERLAAMRSLSLSGFENLMVSIEPIMDFNLPFPEDIRALKPRFVYVGYDNYNCKLPEPPLKKTLSLIKKLRKFTTVRTKTIREAWYERESP